jgi:hypothetical protein
MSDIAPLGRAAATAFGFTHRAPQSESTPDATTGRAADKAEFSTASRFLSRLRDLPPRQGLIDQVQSDIAAGTYETDAKFDAAIESLLSDFEDTAGL